MHVWNSVPPWSDWGDFHVWLRNCAESIHAYICCKWVILWSPCWNITHYGGGFPHSSWNKIKGVAEDIRWNREGIPSGIPHLGRACPLAACTKEGGEGSGSHGLVWALVSGSDSADRSTSSLNTVETTGASLMVEKAACFISLQSGLQNSFYLVVTHRQKI